MISFNPRLTTPQTQELVIQALEQGDLSAGGPFTDKVGSLISDLHLGAHTYLTKSCTTALEFAALLLSIGPGDEVILPSFTFSSTANAFALRGASLKFADIDPATFSAELPQITPHLTKKTRAVVTMAYGGVTRDIKTISHHCQALNIPLVQDNALGLFATIDGTPLGAIGDMSTLSFHQTKSLSCGEGGALVINKPMDIDRADCIANNGTNRLAFLRGAVDNYTWQTLGSNISLSELLAAVLSAQFEIAEEWQTQRKAIWSIYNEHTGQQFRGLLCSVIIKSSRHLLA